MTVHKRKRGGFTFVEILCVLALLTLVFGLLASLLFETLGIERTQAATFERMAQHQALADLFRADTAMAEQSLPEWGAFKAGPHTLILKTKAGHIVYVWQDEKLQRRDFDGENEHSIVMPVDADRVGVEFSGDAAVGRLLRLRLTALRDGGAVPGQTLEIVAALGGDWR